MATEERFWAKVDRSGGEGACWLWLAGKTNGGYGAFGYEGGTIAHRYAYELAMGPIPSGLAIDHLCRNRSCVNPAHLEAVTPLENILRSPGNVIDRHRAATMCPQGHPYEGYNLIIQPDGGRACRECGRQAQRDYQKRLQLKRMGDNGTFMEEAS